MKRTITFVAAGTGPFVFDSVFRWSLLYDHCCPEAARLLLFRRRCPIESYESSRHPCRLLPRRTEINSRLSISSFDDVFYFFKLIARILEGVPLWEWSLECWSCYRRPCCPGFPDCCRREVGHPFLNSHRLQDHSEHCLAYPIRYLKNFKVSFSLREHTKNCNKIFYSDFSVSFGGVGAYSPEIMLYLRTIFFFDS